MRGEQPESPRVAAETHDVTRRPMRPTCAVATVASKVTMRRVSWRRPRWCIPAYRIRPQGGW